MASTSKDTFRVLVGPTKWDLAVALFEGSKAKRSIIVVGTEDQSIEYLLSVTSVQSKNFSTDNWNVEGLATRRGGTGMVNQRVFLEYDSLTQSGVIRFM